MGFGNPLTAGQLAAAIAGTTLTVQGTVSTANPTTPGTDEDTVRVLDQTGINALTASDKSTNYLIYNTTTNALNYVVNGAVLVTGVVVGNYSGNAAARSFNVGFRPDFVVVVTSGRGSFGLITSTDNSLTQSFLTAGSTSSSANGDALTATGFSLGAASLSNSNGLSYQYTAVKA